MPRIYEDRAKNLLRETGVAVPRGRAARTPEEAAAAFREIGGPAVVKALVPVGKRGKAGAVRTAASAEEAAEAARALFGRTVHNFPVERVLVEERLDIARELYLSVTFDSLSRSPVVLLSREGGIEIEELLEEKPGALHRLEVDILEGLAGYQAREFVLRAGLTGKTMVAVAEAVRSAYVLFCRTDARIVEVNPLAVTGEGRVVAAACVLDVDADAFFRQPRIASLLDEGSSSGWRPPTGLEKKVAEIDAAVPPYGVVRFREIEGGEIALMWSGGGGGLHILDLLEKFGGKPANTFDITPVNLEEKFYRITKLLLTMPNVRGALAGSNITSFSRVQLKVQAINRALRDTGVDPRKFPFIVRFAGTGGEEAKAIAAEMPGLQYFGEEITFEDAAAMIVRQVEAAKRGAFGRQLSDSGL